MVFLRALVCSAVVGILGHASTAKADLVLFGSFNQSEAGTPFVFDSATGTMTGTAEVHFNFVGQPSVDATATVTMTTTQPVSEFIIAGTPMLQVPYDTIDVTVTANTPINGKTNLLTMHSAGGGSFREDVGGTTVDIGGQGNAPGLLFTSDFLAFSPTGLGAFSIGLITNAGVAKDPITGFLTSDTPANGPLSASMNSQFSADFNAAVVPEPSSIALTALGALGISGVLYRRRNRLQA